MDSSETANPDLATLSAADLLEMRESLAAANTVLHQRARTLSDTYYARVRQDPPMATADIDAATDDTHFTLTEINEHRKDNEAAQDRITEELSHRLLDGPATLVESSLLRAGWNGTLNLRDVIAREMRRRAVAMHPAIVDVTFDTAIVVTDTGSEIEVEALIPVVAVNRITDENLDNLGQTIADIVAAYGGAIPTVWMGTSAPDGPYVVFEVWEGDDEPDVNLWPLPSGIRASSLPFYRVAYSPRTFQASVMPVAQEEDAPVHGSLEDVFAVVGRWIDEID